MSTRKTWDYLINLKKRFMLRKEKVYSLSQDEREKVREFIQEQLYKEYIRSSKLPQMALVFFVGKKNGKKHMVYNYKYLNK